MDTARLIRSLERSADVVPALVEGLDAGDARQRGPDGAWSIVEIISHLADEEVEDFRTRVERTLRDANEAWPPIDPEGVAVERRYNDNDLAESVARFVRERRASVEWLRSLSAPDWEATYRHPQGPLRAGDVLASWVAHDHLHLRQLAKRQYELTVRHGAPYRAAYAGPW